MSGQDPGLIRKDILNRYRGCLIGLACGDALGTTLEFKPPGSFQPIEDICGGGPFGLAAGQWTDDTSMALCLAESLVVCQAFNAHDQMDRYIRWYKQGHLSSTGRCFDIGNTTRESLNQYLISADPFAGSERENTQGNGSIMRLAPVPMSAANDPARAIQWCGESSRTTHGAKTCIDACRYLGALIVGALRGATKEQLLSAHHCPIDAYWLQHPLCNEIDQIAAGSFKQKDPPAIRGTGYVVQSLEAALWAFHKSQSFEHGCLLAVNLGDDADTTGAIYGQLAGAFYGEHNIPSKWRARLALRATIESFADGLFHLSQNQATS